MRTIMARLVAALGLLLGALTLGAVASADGGNSDAAHACQHGGYANYTRTDGTTFANQGQCVSYAARGGTLKPKPTATITGVAVFFTDAPSGFQDAAVSGTGFLPNTRITFTVTFANPSGQNYSTLNSNPPVFTDASGSFNSGTSPTTTRTYINLNCAANPITVTATDGTNTASYDTTVPAC